MKELTEIAAAWEMLRREGRDALLATVVAVSGSTYRRPGARMLLTTEGRLAGSVSGGCLEGDILKKAWWRTQNGPALVTYDSTDEDDIVWGFGLGCNGIVQVLMERVSPLAPGPLDLLHGVFAHRQPGVIATVIGSDGSAARLGERLLLYPDGNVESLLTDAALANRIQQDSLAALRNGASRTETYPLAAGRVDVLLEVVHPPLPLVIFGAGHDTLPLIHIAKELGWHVTVVETRSAQTHPERFPQADAVLAYPPKAIARPVLLDPRTAAVVMTHNYPDDRRVLQTLLASPVGYIGQLGPRARTERLLAEMQDDGFPLSEAQTRRLHAPIGLDLGADNPEEIALAIVAEIQAVFAGRSGTSLRGRREPLHRRATNTPPDSGRRNGAGHVSTVGLLILAAGASRRLGTPKQLLRDGGGQTLIRRAAETALASSCRPVAVVLGASAEAVQSELDGLPLTAVHNPDWVEGMASSLRAGLAALTADASPDAVIVMLCDQPRVSPALLDALVAAHQTSGHALVACEYGGTLGVPALFHRSLFEALNKLTGDEGARRVIKAYAGPVTYIPFPEGQFDIDTEADSERLRQSKSP